MSYRVLPGKERVFEAACQRILDAMQGIGGHSNSSLFHRVNDPSDRGDPGTAEYLILSHWNDEDAYRDFLASERFRKVTQWGLNHILAGRPNHTTYRES